MFGMTPHMENFTPDLIGCRQSKRKSNLIKALPAGFKYQVERKLSGFCVPALLLVQSSLTCMPIFLKIQNISVASKFRKGCSACIKPSLSAAVQEANWRMNHHGKMPHSFHLTKGNSINLLSSTCNGDLLLFLGYLTAFTSL